MFNAKLRGRSAYRAAFTLVELMIVVVIVAILATVSVPIYRASMKDAKMSEGIAGVGMIHTAARVQIAKKGSLTSGMSINDLGIEDTDLDGKYFNQSTDGAYTFVTAGGTAYTISATLDGDSDWTYKIDENGAEIGTYP